MPKGVPRAWPPIDEVRAVVIEKRGVIEQVARHFGVTGPSMRHHLNATGLLDECRKLREQVKAQPKQQEEDAIPATAGMSVTSEATPDPGDIEQLLRDRGLNPAEWVVTAATVNEWHSQSADAGVIPLRQLKANIAPLNLAELILPARAHGSYRRPAPSPATDGAFVVAFLPDPHAPFHDKELHGLVCSWLRRNRPAEVVVLGDLLDLPKPSRHRETPEWTASVNECIQAGYEILRDYVASAPKARFRLLLGNHDVRIRHAVIEHLRSLFGIRRASTETEPGEEVLSLAHLLRLDELQVELIDPQGEYAHGQATITPHLAARHGWIARKGSGASALATLQHLGYSVVAGHTHRQGLVYATTHDIDGRPSTLTACEAGTLAKVAGGLGYAVSPDWQQGFATASIWPDGRFRLDLATYVAGSLLWRDQRYDAPALAAA